LSSKKPKQGYKLVKSLFGKYQEIPKDWKWEKLVENSTIKGRIGWQGLTTAEYREQGKFYLVTGTDFKDGRIDWDNCVYVDEERYVQDPNIQLKNEDVLVTKDGTIGKIALVTDISLPATLNTGVFVIRPINKKYIPLYFFYVLNSNHFLKFLIRLKAGSTINHLYQKDFVNFYFSLPQYTEQQKIVSILTNINNLIKKYDSVIETTKELKKGLIQQLLTKGIDHKKFKKINWYYNKQRIIPAEWELLPLYSLCTLLNGMAFKPEDWKKSGTPIIRIQNLNNHNAKFNYYEKTVAKNLYVKNGDVLFSWAGNLGTSIGSFIWNRGSGILNQHIFKVVPKANTDSLFLYYILGSFVREIEQKTHGAARQIHIRKGELYSRKIPVPPKNEQIRIASILKSVDGKINDLKSKKSNLKKIKNGLIQKLLTGQIRV